MNALPKWDVAVAADMCVDLVLRGNVRPRFDQVEQLIDDFWLDAGGSANIFASQITKLGGVAGVVGWVGRDVFGRFLMNRLRELGVDTSHVKADSSLRTGLGVALAEQADRAILTYPGTIAALAPDDLPTRPEHLCRHWHIASFFLMPRLRPAWLGFLRRCRDAGVTTSFDPNWDPDTKWEGVTGLLPWVDVVMANESEAIAISGKHGAAEAARALSRRGPLVVVKCGKDAAIAANGDQVWSLHPSEIGATVPPIVDTVGAGDNFDAGFVRAWLMGRTVPECLALGHRCAVASLAAAGGIAAQLTTTVAGLKSEGA